MEMTRELEAPRETSFNLRKEAFNQLQVILNDYLEQYPHVSINGLSKRCRVSEPTLRRIKKGQLKTLPSVTTLVEILSYFSKEKDVQEVIKTYGGPLGKYLELKAPQVETGVKIEVSEELTQQLKDPVKYLIFKLTCNQVGVSTDKVVELFGRYGERQISALVQEKLIELREGRYHSTLDYFALSNEVFVEHFKSVADFIKVNKHADATPKYSPVFSNYSSGLTKQAYSEVLKVYRTAFKKMAHIITRKENHGPIPAFILGAVDTLDHRCADEFPDQN